MTSPVKMNVSFGSPALISLTFWIVGTEAAPTAQLGSKAGWLGDSVDLILIC